MRNNNMAKSSGYPFADLTRLELETIVAKAKAERAEAIRRFFTAVLRRRSTPKLALPEFETNVPARVRPC